MGLISDIADNLIYNLNILKKLEQLTVCDIIEKEIFYNLKKYITKYNDELYNSQKLTKHNIEMLIIFIRSNKSSINNFKCGDTRFIRQIVPFLQKNKLIKLETAATIAENIYESDYIWRTSIADLFKKINNQIPKLIFE